MTITEQLVKALQDLHDHAPKPKSGSFPPYIDAWAKAHVALAAYEASKVECPKCKDFLGKCPYCGRGRELLELTTPAQGQDIEGLVEVACTAFVWYGADPPYMPPYLRQRMRAALLAVQKKLTGGGNA